MVRIQSGPQCRNAPVGSDFRTPMEFFGLRLSEALHPVVSLPGYRTDALTVGADERSEACSTPPVWARRVASSGSI